MKELKQIRSVDGKDNFGHFYVCIKPLVANLENKSKHYIEQKTGLDHKTIQKLLDGTHVRTEHSVIEKICYCFECDITDFCKYIPPKE